MATRTYRAIAGCGPRMPTDYELAWRNFRTDINHALKQAYEKQKKPEDMESGFVRARTIQAFETLDSKLENIGKGLEDKTHGVMLHYTISEDNDEYQYITTSKILNRFVGYLMESKKELSIPKAQNQIADFRRVIKYIQEGKDLSSIEEQVEEFQRFVEDYLIPNHDLHLPRPLGTISS